MSKIILSRTGNEYDLAPNGFGKDDNKLSLIVMAGEESIEMIEDIFTANDLIKMVDNSVIVNAHGYTVVESIGIHHDYVIGSDEDNDITADVWAINLKKASLEDRVSANEDAIAELAEIVSEV